MNDKQKKLENPLRLEELNPQETLGKIGLEKKHVLCDIGAGSGIFTIPAARMTENKVIALEISEEMLAIIKEKAKAQGIANIELRTVKDDTFEVPDHSADIVLLVTVLHEINNKTVFLKEIKRIIKVTGKLAIIEFHKAQTPMGPPLDHRLGKNEVLQELSKSGFGVIKDFDLGPNYYCMVAEISKIK